MPREFVKDGEIVPNVGVEATHQLLLGNEEISFQARFGGKAFPVVVPIARVAAVYARENGDGMAFEVGEGAEVASGEPSPAAEEAIESPADTPTDRPSGRPFLTRVK